MILHDVADRADLLVEASATLDADLLRHRNLHARDEVAIPHRLQEGIGEAEIQKVLHGLLAEVVIDTKY